jgi:3-hydroxymyristoyl/3-hydroxydecanoyl-(acyl carrier protein) dehydratase
MLAVEVMAQAALLVLGSAVDGDEAAGGGLLAGLDTVTLHAPLRPGDRLRAQAELLARMGPLVKVRCALRRGEALVVEGSLLLALGT